MNKKSINKLISSTPNPQRTFQHLTEPFENDMISPINDHMELQYSVLKSAEQKSNSARLVPEVNTFLTKKKRSATRRKEITSNAVFKELEKSQEINKINILSQSRNMYNMYPQPILLDSDEENDLLKTSTIHLKTHVEKDNLVTKSSASTTRVKRKITKGERNKILVTDLDPGKHTNTPSLELDTKRVFINKIEIPEKQSPSIFILDNEENNKLCQYVLENDVCVNNNKKNNKTLVEDSYKKNIIKWTPEKLKRIKVVDNTLTSKKYHFNNKSDEHQNGHIDQIRNIVVCDENNGTIRREENSYDTKLCGTVEERVTTKNNFSSVYLSRFESVIFKHNKHSGGIVAKCLQTDNLNFGYLEVVERQAFLGQRSNITFVLLEGDVTATIHGSTKTLKAGDILHIETDTKYQFNNHGYSHARLLYVKENIS